MLGGLDVLAHIISDLPFWPTPFLGQKGNHSGPNFHNLIGPILNLLSKLHFSICGTLWEIPFLWNRHKSGT